MKTAVAFFIYKRPECTSRVWDGIRKARPPVLFVIADGPRNEAERPKCEACRAVVEDVDWPCDVRRNYADTNMGCKERMSSGLNWVFQEVEQAIILEDDCLPDPSFFRFCDELLERYRDDGRIMHISGNNFLRGKVTFRESYYFSKYPYIWGWATWQRAWKHYDLAMRDWPEFRDNGGISRMCPNPKEAKYWLGCLEDMHAGALNTWDYAWLYAVWAQNGVAILPAVNLVSNIGTGSDATHTAGYAWFMNLPVEPIGMLIHPASVTVCRDADDVVFADVCMNAARGSWQRVVSAMCSPWTYGKIIRRLPVVGAWWASHRTRLKTARKVIGPHS